ncbi:MAG: UDP-N-acetylglucosamine 2-epimerase (non-hydrolyzing) [Anaerolineae bacterium]|nr:UDP-N-acetylglucosamine 2-epimerase (non-hydrolyzing) [Anaerolineae bacterium]
MTRILLIFGTRPEAIKMARLVHVLKERPGADAVTCVTAQHRQMLDQVLDWFRVEPDYDLDLMQPGQTLAQLTTRTLDMLTPTLEQVQPDVVVVQGDTTTAMTAALAAFYLRIPVGHVEAGLRTHDIYNPFPEEINRHLISVMANLHFVPTETARSALLAEGARPEAVYLTGNTVIDALQWTAAQPYQLDIGLPVDRPGERLILVTGHRRESFGPAFESICLALQQIVERNPTVRLIYPVHLNPNVQEPVYRILDGVERIHLLDPLPYPDFVHLMKRSTLIITDSGGIQEEAPALGKPVLVMRSTTERPEAIDAGTARLVGTDTKSIIAEAEKLLHNEAEYDAMANAASPFGDGHAAERIADVLLSTHPTQVHRKQD